MTGGDMFLMCLLYVLFVAIVAGLSDGKAWEETSKFYNAGVWKETQDIVKSWNLRIWAIPFAYALALFLILIMFILSGYILSLPFKLLGFLLFKRD